MSNGQGQPHITFPEELPVSQMRDEIAAAIREHQVVIVAGETGSGKTTQIPKIALELGREAIAHTQPRRIAARTIAERIAEELGTELGGLVGYQVRFTDQVSRDTKIRLMTDGILLNAIHRDRDLRAYDTIIIDEAHERSLNIDFLIGYLKTLLPRRPDLKVIITSATIDPESFAEHFADPVSGKSAPIIEVSGRNYPVEIRYRPLVEQVSRPDPKTGVPKVRTVERDLFDAIGEAVDELAREAHGDVLVFLSGEAEIRDAADALGGRQSKSSRGSSQSTEILPLYGRLSSAEQHRVFERSKRSGVRRIVLATNVAETSLTVPGIRYVIDAGTARISRYSARSKVQRLPIEAIAQASAQQRSGRSGRTSAGIAIRLYSEEDFNSRPEFTEPEVRRTGLASVILQMLSLGLGDIAGFPFLTPPDQRGIADGIGLLSELGAVRTDGKGARAKHQITKTGRDLARLPIEPRFARMVIEAKRHNVVPAVLAIVAGLTIQDVRERPQAERAKADQFHARFHDPLGDLLTLLNLWNYLQEKQHELSSSAFRRLCKAEFLNFLRIREWMDLVRQLSRAAGIKRSMGDRGQNSETGGSADAIHRSVLAGLLSQLGARDDRTQQTNPARSGPSRPAESHRRKPAQEYLGSRGTRFVLYPGSVLAKKPPEVVMSVELVETSRLFARSNAVVDPAWAEELAGPLAKRQLSEPHWERKQGAAVAVERVTLYGVPIITGRRVQLARFDLEQARELFIRHALVEGDWYTGSQHSPHAFDRANIQLRRELEQLEERTRRRDIISDDETIFEFYDSKIPKNVASTRDFEGWWKEKRSADPHFLHLRREELLESDDDQVDERVYPRKWMHGDQTLRLRYRFDPTAEDDGVTVNVPLPLLPRLTADDFEKLVPGMREELVTALIKTLPKAIRKHVVPAGDWARSLLGTVEAHLGDGRLTQLLATEIRRRTSVQVTAEDFDAERLPNHLTPTFRVIDTRGRTIGSGKNLAELQRNHKTQATEGVAKVAQAALPKSDVERTGVTTWTFGDLPRHVDSAFAKGRTGSAGVVRAYPAIVDRRTSVDLVLVASEAEQLRLSRRGIRRLISLSSPSPASYIRDHLSNQEKILLGAGPYRSLDVAIADVSLAVADRMIHRHAPDGLVWEATVFEAIADGYARSLIDEIYAAIALTARVLDGARLARKAIDQAKSIQVLGQVADASKQIDGLVFDRFVSRTGLEQLERIPVYLEAIRLRMSGLSENAGRDRVWQNEVDRALVLYADAGGTIPLPETHTGDGPETPASIVRTRWLIEELRVSLFAQSLRTAEPVSLKRIQKMLATGNPTYA
ncbi:MAG: ATP-dependent RNA helicase HrpA [Leucobacter sp.]